MKSEVKRNRSSQFFLSYLLLILFLNSHAQANKSLYLNALYVNEIREKKGFQQLKISNSSNKVKVIYKLEDLRNVRTEILTRENVDVEFWDTETNYIAGTTTFSFDPDSIKEDALYVLVYFEKPADCPCERDVAKEIQEIRSQLEKDRKNNKFRLKRLNKGYAEVACIRRVTKAEYVTEAMKFSNPATYQAVLMPSVLEEKMKYQEYFNPAAKIMINDSIDWIFLGRSDIDTVAHGQGSAVSTSGMHYILNANFENGYLSEGTLIISSQYESTFSLRKDQFQVYKGTFNQEGKIDGEGHYMRYLTSRNSRFLVKSEFGNFKNGLFDGRGTTVYFNYQTRSVKINSAHQKEYSMGKPIPGSEYIRYEDDVFTKGIIPENEPTGGKEPFGSLVLQAGLKSISSDLLIGEKESTFTETLINSIRNNNAKKPTSEFDSEEEDSEVRIDFTKLLENLNFPDVQSSILTNSKPLKNKSQ